MRDRSDFLGQSGGARRLKPMGQAPSGQGGGPPPERDPEKEKAERERRKKSYAARPPLHTGRRRRRNRGTGTSGKLPKVYPTSKCKLRLLKRVARRPRSFFAYFFLSRLGPSATDASAVFI